MSYANIYQCMAGGGAYAAYLRIGLSDGSALYKRAATAEKRFGAEGLVAVRAAQLTEYQLRGKEVVRVGVTDSDGGAELAGGTASVRRTGENEITVECALTLPAPDGWLGSERLFDALTGCAPLPRAFSFLSDRGERAEGRVKVDTEGIKIAADFAAGLEYVTLCCEDEPALLLYPPGEKEVTGTAAVAADDEIYPRVSNQTALVELTLVGTPAGSPPLGASAVEVPLALGKEESVTAPAGLPEAFGKYLVLRGETEIHLFGPGLKLLAARSAAGIACVSVAESGAMAFAAEKGIRVCVGPRDLCVIAENAVSVVLTDDEDGYRLYYLSGGRLHGARIAADGACEELWSVVSDCLQICERADGLFGVGAAYMRHYAADGAELARFYINGGPVTKIIGMSRGMAVVATADGKYSLLTPYSQRGAAGTPKALTGRLILTEEGGLYAYDRPADREICRLEAEGVAYADKLYYVADGRLMCRRPLKTETRLIGGGAFYGDSVTFKVRAKNSVAAACTFTAALTLT